MQSSRSGRTSGPKPPTIVSDADASRAAWPGDGAGARTIVYLHGFNSSPQSVKGRMLGAAARRMRPPPRWWSPALDHRPARAMHDVMRNLDAARIASSSLAFIGSSLGGYYATFLAERYGARCVAINPAVNPGASLAGFLGTQRNLHTGEAYELTQAHLDELAHLRVDRITWPQRYLLLVTSGDELLDWRKAVRFYSGAYQYLRGGGDHGWTDFEPEVAMVLRFAGREA